MTRYLVLKRKDPKPEPTVSMSVSAAAEASTTSTMNFDADLLAPSLWQPLDLLEAHSAEAAIRKAVEREDSDDGGEYVAVTAASWKPTTAVVNIQTRVVVG